MELYLTCVLPDHHLQGTFRHQFSLHVGFASSFELPSTVFITKCRLGVRNRKDVQLQALREITGVAELADAIRLADDHDDTRSNAREA